MVPALVLEDNVKALPMPAYDFYTKNGYKCGYYLAWSGLLPVITTGDATRKVRSSITTRQKQFYSKVFNFSGTRGSHQPPVTLDGEMSASTQPMDSSIDLYLVPGSGEWCLVSGVSSTLTAALSPELF